MPVGIAEKEKTSVVGVETVRRRQADGAFGLLALVVRLPVVLVVGATDEHVTLLAEVDADAVEAALRERRTPAQAGAVDDGPAPYGPAIAARSTSPALAGSVFDRNGWGSLVSQLRERTVRKS